MADKIKFELASITVNYGPPQTSLFGNGAAAQSNGVKKSSIDGTQTEIEISDNQSAADQPSVRLLKFDTFLSLFTMITRYSKQITLPSLKE